jgi:hypothetical protein
MKNNSPRSPMSRKLTVSQSQTEPGSEENLCLRMRIQPQHIVNNFIQEDYE